MDLNQANLIGRLTRDPESRTIASGQSLCSFSVACGRKFKGQDGTQKEETLFIDCTAWGKTAEHIGQYLKKGSRVYVGGRLRLETWEDKNSGGKRNKISLVAENVIFLDGAAKQEEKPRLAPANEYDDYGDVPF